MGRRTSNFVLNSPRDHYKVSHSVLPSTPATRLRISKIWWNSSRSCESDHLSSGDVLWERWSVTHVKDCRKTTHMFSFFSFSSPYPSINHEWTSREIVLCLNSSTSFFLFWTFFLLIHISVWVLCVAKIIWRKSMLSHNSSTEWASECTSVGRATFLATQNLPLTLIISGGGENGEIKVIRIRRIFCHKNP